MSVIGQWVLSLVLVTAAAAGPADQPYLYNIYLHAGNRPLATVLGRCVYDLSTEKGWDVLFDEFAALGINAVTFHSVYRPEGAIYAHHNPRLKHAPQWKGLKPVKWFLEACQRRGIAGYLGIYLGRIQDPDLARAAIEDVVTRFRGHPAFKGLVPPIEASPSAGIDDPAFLSLAARAKQLEPRLIVMDYPPGPLSRGSFASLINRALSPAVDVHNVQFYVDSQRFTDFADPRGMTLLGLGACPGKRMLVHTHYMKGMGRWIEQDEAYKVRQGALLTVTPYGISMWSYLHGCWGWKARREAPPEDTLWRRIAWYEGVLSGQRLVPLYAQAESAAEIAIMIPRYPTLNSPTFLQELWRPLARAHFPVHFFLNGLNFGSGRRVVLVPHRAGLSTDQLWLLERFVRAGGTLLVLTRHEPREVPLSPTLSPRARRILGLTTAYPPPPEVPPDLPPAFATALGLPTEGTPLVPPRPQIRSYGEGMVALLPPEEDWFTLARPWLEPVRRVRVDNLPPEYLVEHWRCPPGAPAREFIWLLATRPNSEARQVVISVRAELRAESVFLLTDTTLERLAEQRLGDTLTVSVPRVDDSYAVLLFAPGERPLLHPTAKLVQARAGETVQVAWEVLNTASQVHRVEMTLTGPPGWRLEPTEARWELKPKEQRRLTVQVTVPTAAEKKPYFVVARAAGQTQRTMVFPTDGRPRWLTDQPLTPEEWRPPVVRTLGAEWARVIAGKPRDNYLPAHNPGVCFLDNPEWDAPGEWQGKSARYGEFLPHLGGPNFYVSGVQRGIPLEVRVTYWSEKGGKVSVYDGTQYHLVGRLPGGTQWQTVSFPVPPRCFAPEAADRSPLPGLTVMFQFETPAIYVHQLEARQLKRDQG
ncbi:MAG TPA: hypothetical protein EYP85_09785 [Armatimonadetes bacterium]|nr:hypothetical protein [Armatimonadota bacterium]